MADASSNKGFLSSLDFSSLFLFASSSASVTGINQTRNQSNAESQNLTEFFLLLYTVSTDAETQNLVFGRLATSRGLHVHPDQI